VSSATIQGAARVGEKGSLHGAVCDVFVVTRMSENVGCEAYQGYIGKCRESDHLESRTIIEDKDNVQVDIGTSRVIEYLLE
tara:strand:- start:1111 stop:1353 length:243 start_codon:yes stop_codon:yes gene_type:complete